MRSVKTPIDADNAPIDPDSTREILTDFEMSPPTSFARFIFAHTADVLSRITPSFTEHVLLICNVGHHR
jgi:hypothetical protein